jgi:membrane protease YdiL (CAAX protease family)
MASESETNVNNPSMSDKGPNHGSATESGESVLLTSAQSPRPWGLWATIGWTLLCVVVLFAAQTAALIIFLVAGFATNHSVPIEKLPTNGNVIALAILLGTAAVVGLIALLVRVRHYPIGDYLALTMPPARSVLTAIAGLAVLLCSSDLISYSLGRPLVPAVMVDVYQTAWLPWLLFAVVVVAPLGEEALFRGFLYQGVAGSRAGPIVAIIVSTFDWALLHVQYDWYGIVSIAAAGLYLGVVRYGAGSLLLTILLHAVSNVVATVELVVQEHWLG